jgi:hypothetical protein
MSYSLDRAKHVYYKSLRIVVHCPLLSVRLRSASSRWLAMVSRADEKREETPHLFALSFGHLFFADDRCSKEILRFRLAIRVQSHSETESIHKANVQITTSTAPTHLRCLSTRTSFQQTSQQMRNEG